MSVRLRSGIKTLWFQTRQAWRWWRSRCATCGRRFGWHESPVTIRWGQPDAEAHHVVCFRG